MGAFNVLLVRTRCASCGEEADLHLQFKYGDTWQMEYKLGDKLRWGGNDIGTSGPRRVVLDAPAEPCPNCGFQEDFEIFVESGRLTRFQRASHQYDFTAHQESFSVLDPEPFRVS
jgi:hypothetical protein